MGVLGIDDLEMEADGVIVVQVRGVGVSSGAVGVVGAGCVVVVARRYGRQRAR